MIDGWHDERDSYDTLYVPFVWVPDGAPQPTEWLAEHPDAFWVPATLVRDQFAVDDPDMGGDDFGQPDGAAQAGGVGEPLSFEGSRSPWPVEDQAVAASTASAASRYDDPVAAYLRIDDMFARLGIGGCLLRQPDASQSPQRTTGAPADGQQAQAWLPLLLDEPPVIVRPPLKDFPNDPAEPPGPGFQWRGRPGSKPGDPNGNWFNPETGATLRPDLGHPRPFGPHYDYRAPDGRWYRWFPNGEILPKG